MRRLLPLIIAVAAAATTATPAAAGGVVTGTQRITGGRAVLIGAVPWQVRIQVGSFGICGGALLDDLHVVTAAHCTYSGRSRLRASALRVVSGSSSFDENSDAMRPNGPTTDVPITSRVSSVRRHPRYTPTADGSTSLARGRDDAAVLTLAEPVPLDGIVRQAIALPERNSLLPTGTRLSVSGFGLIEEGSARLDGRLHQLTDMKLLEPAANSGRWNAAYLAVSSPTGLDCNGDSGGPLVHRTDAGPVLVGLVSFSPDCDPRTVSTYTSVAAGEIRDFLLGDDTPPAVPIGGQDARITADRRGVLPIGPGRVLTCDPGSWTGAPAFTYAFSDDRGAVLQDGPAPVYTVAERDRGRRIGCQATATADGGVGRSVRTERTAAIGSRQIVGPPAGARIVVAMQVRSDTLFPGDRFRVTLRLRSTGRRAATGVRG